jgi:pimeloyl-ACP methyl ester carboxylesterase
MRICVIIWSIVFSISCKPPSSVTHQNNSAQKIETITVNGLTISYVEAGSGPTVILIHGSVSDYREWSTLVSALSKHYHVIAYSRRYHAPNPGASADADAGLDLQVDDLFQMMRAIGINSAHLVGHSLGGAVALGFAVQHPDMVQSLVLAEPAVNGVLSKTPENDSVMKESQDVRARMKEVFATGNSQQIVKTYAMHVAPGDFEKTTPEERKMLMDNVAAFQLDFNSRRTPFTCDDAKKITVPVLVLAGDQSPMGLQRIAETAASCIKGAKFARIPKATHWMQLDQPQVFNKEVIAFLRQNKK